MMNTRENRKIPISDKMTALLYFDRLFFFGIAGLLFGLSFLIGGALLYSMMKQTYNKRMESPGYFDSFQSSGYNTTSLQFMTDYFAEHIKEGYRLYFGFDSTWRPFILSTDGEAPEELQTFIDFTQGDWDFDQPPEPIKISGYSRPLTSEIMGYARDSYSQMWSDEEIPISSDELSEIVGNYYLDTRPSSFWKEYPMAATLFAIPMIFFAAGAYFLFRYRKWVKLQFRRAKSCEEWVQLADQELGPVQKFQKWLPVYLTEHFLVTAACYFDVIPYADIETFSEIGGFLTAVTVDGNSHIIAEKKKCRGSYTQLVTELMGKLDNQR